MVNKKSLIEMYYDGEITSQDYIRLIDDHIKKMCQEIDIRRKIAEERVDRIKEILGYTH